ncbi:ubiquitin-specific protease, partial [Rhizoctonia solani]
MQGQNAKVLGALLHHLYPSPNSSAKPATKSYGWDNSTYSYAPREFKHTLGKFAPAFSGYQQHDTQQFLRFLLGRLHKDLNQVLKNPYVEKPEWPEEGGDKKAVAKETWEGYKKRNKSIIVDLFQSVYKSMLVYPECSKVPWDARKRTLAIEIEVPKDSNYGYLKKLFAKWFGVEAENVSTPGLSPARAAFLFCLDLCCGWFFPDSDSILCALIQWYCYELYTRPQSCPITPRFPSASLTRIPPFLSALAILPCAEVWSHKFCKFYDDYVNLTELTKKYTLVVYELPVPVKYIAKRPQTSSFTFGAKPKPPPKPNPNAPFLLPGFHISEAQRSTVFGVPFFVLLTLAKASSRGEIYRAVVERCERWAKNKNGEGELAEQIPPEADEADEAVTEIRPQADEMKVEVVRDVEMQPAQEIVAKEEASTEHAQDDGELASLADPQGEEDLEVIATGIETGLNMNGSCMSVKSEIERVERHKMFEKRELMPLPLGSGLSVMLSPEGPKVGAGFVVYHKGVLITELSKGIGPRFEVFDAEMIALAEAASCAVSKASSLGSHHIIFFADNKAALSNITLLSKHPGQYASRKFRSAIDAFLLDSPLNKVELRCVPGHEGVEGNERADVLANEGGSEPPLHTYNRSITWCKAEATRTASRTWTQEWSNQPHSRFIADHIRRNPSLSLHPFFKAFPYHRAIHARLNQVIMGHAFLGEYRERFRPDDDPSCPCGAPRQTLDHVLRACPSYDHARLSLRKASGPILNSSLFGTTSGLRALATFINSTDAFQI